MESLSDTLWDVVICGTGLKQSLLALSLSRSGKNILHVDPNEYYGGPEAAFSLDDVDVWVAGLSASEESSVFRNASVTKPSGEATTALKSPRQYSLALAPQFVHSRSALVSQLVSSRAYRQVEFLAVGSFFTLKSTGGDTPTLNQIPSTREDVFSTTAIPARAKRSLMKFLKFVLERSAASDAEQTADSASEEPRDPLSTEWAGKPLVEFLQAEFKLEQDLQAYILALTLSLDGRVSTKDGLTSIQTHLNSMGVFGPGFAAVYPKWGGLSEIAQVGCRAGAVGGGVYMLGTGIKNVKQAADGDGHKFELPLTSGETVKAKLLVTGEEKPADGPETAISRLVAVVSSPLTSLFTSTIEGAPKPAVAVVALPPGSVDPSSEHPIFAFAHSSDTGECPLGQSVIYLTMLATATSKTVLESSLASLLAALTDDGTPEPLYQLYYEQSTTPSPVPRPINTSAAIHLPAPSLSLTFDDGTLDPVRKAWEFIMGEEAGEAEFMIFEDREGADEDDDVYD